MKELPDIKIILESVKNWVESRSIDSPSSSDIVLYTYAVIKLHLKGCQNCGSTEEYESRLSEIHLGGELTEDLRKCIRCKNCHSIKEEIN